MKRKAAAVAALLVLASFSARAATLSDTVAQALSEHPVLDAGRAAAQAARQGVREQRAGHFPTVAVNGSAGRVFSNNDTTRGFVNRGAFSWMGQGGVTWTQPLFAGFGTVNRVRAAHDREDSAQYDLLDMTEEVALRAVHAHLDMMRTRELLKLADDYYNEIRKRHDSITLMVREGAADESEQLQARDAMTSAKNTRLGYEEVWRQAEAGYIEAVGARPDGALELGAAAWERLLPAEVEDAVTRAWGGSPRIMAADSLSEAMHKEAVAARGDLLPRVDAEMSYGRKDQRDVIGGETKDAAALLKMSWNFSTGGAGFARMNRGFAQREEAQARKRVAMRDIEHAVRQKFISMQIVDEQFTLLAAREADMSAVLDSYLSQFEAGKQSNLQIIGAQTKLFEARAGRTDASYRRMLARFELLAAMGALQKSMETAPAPVPVAGKGG